LWKVPAAASEFRRERAKDRYFDAIPEFRRRQNRPMRISPMAAQTVLEGKHELPQKGGFAKMALWRSMDC